MRVARSFVMSALLAVLAYGRFADLKLIANSMLPSIPIDSANVMDIDESFVYIGAANGNLLVYDHSGRLVQDSTVARDVYDNPSQKCQSVFKCGSYVKIRGPITSIASSTDPERYALYIAAGNPEGASGSYIMRFWKNEHYPPISDHSGIVSISEAKDARVAGLGVLGIDLIYRSVRGNAELNPFVSSAVDMKNFYVSSGVEPARAFIGGTALTFPDKESYTANSTVVYDSNTGEIVEVMSNEKIGCAASVYTDGTYLFRGCASLAGTGFLFGSVHEIPGGNSAYYEKRGARTAATAFVDGEPYYLFVGTSFGKIARYRIKNGSLNELSEIDLNEITNSSKTELFSTVYRDENLATDMRVASIKIFKDVIAALIVPRWPRAEAGSFFLDRSDTAVPRLIIFKLM